MHEPPIQVLDTVTLLHADKGDQLSAGMKGAVVEIYSTEECEVEFVSQDGTTMGLHSCRLVDAEILDKLDAGLASLDAGKGISASKAFVTLNKRSSRDA